MPDGVEGAGLVLGLLGTILANVNSAKMVASSPCRKMVLACSSVRVGPSIASSDGTSRVSVPVAMAT
jgi:hypothetical protein